jgi:hypothetical protein
VVLYLWFGRIGLGTGGANATPFEAIPFMGIIRIGIEANLAVFLILGLFIAGIPVVLPTMWSLYHAIQDFLQRNVTLYTCLLLAHAAILPFLPHSTYREYLGVFRAIPGLVLMVVLYSAERDEHRVLMYTTFWITLLLFLTAG